MFSSRKQGNKYVQNILLALMYNKNIYISNVNVQPCKIILSCVKQD
jgi:hypothetical protein